jgi:transposase
MSYSLDFRQKVMAMKQKHGWTFEKTCQHFEISMRTLFRWSNKIEPIKKYTIRKSKIEKDVLLKDVEMYPDSYISERAERLGVSKSAMQRYLKKFNITYKKKSKTSKSGPNKTTGIC